MQIVIATHISCNLGHHFWVKCNRCGKRKLVTVFSMIYCDCSQLRPYLNLEQPLCVVTVCA